MNRFAKILIGAAFTVTSFQQSALAQEDTSPKSDFQKLLDQLEEDDQDNQSTRPDLSRSGLEPPKPPAANTPPVFPKVDGGIRL